jgi:hypothetical protein
MNLRAFSNARRRPAGFTIPLMGRRFPNDFHCAECGNILRALLNDFHVDHREVRRRLRETADASGRTVAEMRNALIASVGTMPLDEQRTLMKAHYPRTVEARRRKAEHETLTGHSVHMHGWARVFGRQPFGGAPPGEN